MKENILKAKHWQIFGLIIGIPWILTNWEGNTMYSLSMLLVMVLIFTWFWAVGTGLQEKIPDNLKMKLKKFKIFLIIPFAYIILLTVFIGTDLFKGEDNKAIIGVIFPLHLFSMFCIFYCLYFVSKTIKTVELGKKVAFGDYAGEFFLTWFFPLGIWFVQPKINKLSEG